MGIRKMVLGCLYS